MNPSEIQPWLVVLSLVMTIASTFYTWLTARSRVNGEHIAKLVDRTTDLERRTDKIETDMRHLPDREQTQRMELTLMQMKGDIAVLNERLQPVAAIADRLQEFLLEQAKK